MEIGKSPVPLCGGFFYHSTTRIGDLTSKNRQYVSNYK